MPTQLILAALLLGGCAAPQEPDLTGQPTGQPAAPYQAWQAVLCGDNDTAAACGWQ